MVPDPAPTVIKATDTRLVTEAAAFNFEDLADRAKRYLEGVKQQATRIIAEAQKEATQIRRRAEDDGKKAGFHQAEQTIRRELEKQLTSLLPALKDAVRQIQEAKHEFLRQWQENVVRLACAVAIKMVRGQVAVDATVMIPLIKETLELAAGSPTIRILLNPQDEQTLRPMVARIVTELAPVAKCEIIADGAVSQGGCRVETQFGTIDAQLETQAARIVEELTMS